jgi:hypothetical protein
MLQLLFNIFKLTVFTILVLIASQIKINNVRICDHTARVLKNFEFENKIKNLSKSVHFVEAKDKKRKLYEEGSTSVSGISKKDKEELLKVIKKAEVKK